jgi:hypothetical protein
MPADIFVDNNIAMNFCNPVEDEYKRFIQWLVTRGYLVVSQKLLSEYVSSTGASPATTNICAIVDRLTRDGRLIKIKNSELRSFKFSKSIERSLRSNKKDWNHLKTILLSHRKYAITMDNDFTFDVNHFPKHNARAAHCPSLVPYDE